MNASKILIYCCLFLTFISVGCTQSNVNNTTLTIATAANMQFAMSALVDEFTRNTAIPCQLVISSSGKLTAQIQEGAPYDIFVAANMKYPKAVFDHDKAATIPKVYAYGQVVLWTMKDELIPSLEHLEDKNIQHIAIANPKTAPYGVAALEILKHNNLLKTINPKLVYGESIAQTNQFITLEAADIGFTAMSVVLSPQMKNKGQWIALDTTQYQPIEQGVVLLKGEKIKTQKAQQFYDFLFSETAQSILHDFGYLSKK